jgi:hypothetical protein
MPPARVIPPATSLAAAVFRSATATTKPRLASSSAIALLIPLAATVTIANLHLISVPFSFGYIPDRRTRRAPTPV